MIYLLYFLIAGITAVLITPYIKRLAFKYQIVNYPGNHPKKIHTTPTPLLGGLAVYLSFLIGLLIYLQFGHADFTIIPKKFFLAIILGGFLLMAGGAIDDKFDLPPKYLWLFPAAASLIIVLSGIGVGITSLTNPFGAPIKLDYIVLGIPLSGIVMWLWMMGMIFTTKFLDGLDGLCAGIGFIATMTMFALSLTSKINQPITASLAIIFGGALFGYLFYAFNPASIFFGESGSTFTGFMIGVLAIILGGKIATALIVMGIPILDIAWVIIRRLWYGQSPFHADRKHLHHRLLDIGFTQKQTVLILYFISALFGFTAVFLQSFGKLIALVILFFVMLALAISAVFIYKRDHPHVPEVSKQ
jgi:UDP-GlcNAc:undecaprenyl-phosphate GlcNAc-1-phosphate transferase